MRMTNSKQDANWVHVVDWWICFVHYCLFYWKFTPVAKYLRHPVKLREL